jgi:hypothetical protein
MKNWQLYAIAVIIILLVIVGLFYQQIKKFIMPAPSVQVITSTTPATQPALDFNKVLKIGMTNSNEVKLLQTWLGGLQVDGDFGPLTQQALYDRIGFNETTLSAFQGIVAQQSSGDGSLYQNQNDNPLGGVSMVNPLTWF